MGCRGTALVVSRTVDLVEVEVLLESAEPDLGEQGPTKVEELVRLVVRVVVGVLAQVLLARHAGPRVNPFGLAVLRLGSSCDAIRLGS
ncbi:hypothetical protein HYQ46_012096 [Verticillium longisporum]|nr:hypothetical protein HYQ46_012096 [Verticillium longisporum]